MFDRLTDVIPSRALIGYYHCIASTAVAMFVDVSYQSDLLGFSAV